MPEKVMAELSEAKGGPRKFETEYDFGNDLAEMTEKFGEQVVFTNAKFQMKTSLRNFLRPAMAPDKDGNAKTDKELAALVGSWKPPAKTATRGKSSVEKALALMSGMSPEEKEALKKALKAQQAAA